MRQSFVTTTVLALLATAAAGFVAFRGAQDATWTERGLTVAVALPITFLTLRMMDRLQRALMGRTTVGRAAMARDEARRGGSTPAPMIEATTDRPDHVARRRSQRRPKGPTTRRGRPQ